MKKQHIITGLALLFLATESHAAVPVLAWALGSLGLFTVGGAAVALAPHHIMAALLTIFNIVAGFAVIAVMLLTLAVLLIYMFAGWFKAMLGLAFAPLVIILFPLDKGRMASGALSFILGGIGSFVFSMAVGLVGMGMMLAGAERMLELVRGVSASVAQGDAGAVADMAQVGSVASMNAVMLLLMLVMSVLILFLVFNAKNWGAEFFGSSSFSMDSKTMRSAAASGIRGAGRAGAGAFRGAATGASKLMDKFGGGGGGRSESALGTAPSGGGFTPITPVPNRGGSQGASGPGLAQGSAGARGLPSPGGGMRSSYGGGGGGAFRPSGKSRFNKDNVTDVVDKSKTKG